MLRVNFGDTAQEKFNNFQMDISNRAIVLTGVEESLVKKIVAHIPNGSYEKMTIGSRTNKVEGYKIHFPKVLSLGTSLGAFEEFSKVRNFSVYDKSKMILASALVKEEILKPKGGQVALDNMLGDKAPLNSMPIFEQIAKHFGESGKSR